MMDINKTIKVQAVIHDAVDKVWKFYTTPEHITQWNYASEDWHTPRAENDLKPGGKFNYRMEARDGSSGFDFRGRYDQIRTNQFIAYTIGDGRKVMITLTENKDQTHVEVAFEAEGIHSLQLQRDGWQAILNNFKKYAEVNNHDSI